MSEVAYYFINLVSAKSFIVDLDGKSLSMDAVEFHESMEAAREAHKATGVEPLPALDQSATLAKQMDPGPSRKMLSGETDTRGEFQASIRCHCLLFKNSFLILSPFPRI